MLTERATWLHEAILGQFHTAVGRFPPGHAPFTTGDSDEQGLRLGEHLVRLGYLAPRQLTAALHTARKQPLRQSPGLFGCTLVAQDLVPAQIVSAVLLMQFLERFDSDPAHAARFLGEELLVQERLGPDQLATVIEEQLEGYQKGSWVRLGDLIVHHGWLKPEAIAAAIQQR